MQLASVLLLLASCQTTISQILDDDTIYPNTCQPTRFKCQAGCWWSGYTTYCSGGYTCKICARVGRGYYSPINNDNRYLCPKGTYSSVKQASSCSTCDPSLYNGLGSTYTWGNYCMLTSMKPSTKPTHKPSIQPQRAPSSQPSHSPIRKTSLEPSKAPSIKPSKKLSRPSKTPSNIPSSFKLPTKSPSKNPSYRPFLKPSKSPSKKPKHKPSYKPQKTPSKQPSHLPSNKPTKGPSKTPLKKPSKGPSIKPSRNPVTIPSKKPSQSPSRKPQKTPSKQPSHSPSRKPSTGPSKLPLGEPSVKPSIKPSKKPLPMPSKKPSQIPSRKRSEQPTKSSSENPSRRPLRKPTKEPSKTPLWKLSQKPKNDPSRKPSSSPSRRPSNMPLITPSRHPSMALSPSSKPFKITLPKASHKLSINPSHKPSGIPHNDPSQRPINEVLKPSLMPYPTHPTMNNPSSKPYLSLKPSKKKSIVRVSASPTKSAKSPLKVECKAGFVGDRCDQCCDIYSREIWKNGVLEANPECTSSQGNEKKFYLTLGKCVECPGMATVLLKYVFSLSLLLTIVSGTLKAWQNPQIIGMLNVSIQYLQFLSLLKIINVSWPTRIICAIQTLSVVNFDGISATFRCYFKVGHYRNLVIMLTFPFVSSFLMTAFYVVARMIHLKSVRCPPKWSFTLSIVITNMYYYSLQWSFTAMQQILCGYKGAALIGSEYCHGYYAAADRVGGKIQRIMLILLVFGIPAAIISALFVKVKRKGISDESENNEIPYLSAVDEDFHVWYRGLYWFCAPYKRKLWYWPIITLAEKVLLVIFLSVFYRNTAVQITTVLVILLATTVCETILLPFACMKREVVSFREKSSAQTLLGAFSTNNNFSSIMLRVSLCSLVGCSLGLDRMNNDSNHLRRSWVTPMMDFSAFVGFATIFTTLAVECGKALKQWWNKICRSKQIVPISDTYDSRMETLEEMINPFEVDNTLNKEGLLQESIVCNGNAITPEPGQISFIGSRISWREEESRQDLSLISDSKMIEGSYRQPVRSSMVSSEVFTTIDDLAEANNKNSEFDDCYAISTMIPKNNESETSNPFLSGNKSIFYQQDLNNRRGLGLRLYYPMGTQPYTARNRREYVADIADFRYRPVAIENVEKPTLNDDGKVGLSDSPKKVKRWYPIKVQSRKEKKGLGLRLYYPSGTHPSRGVDGGTQTERYRKKIA